MYIIDTNTLIYYFKGLGNVSDKLLARSPKEIAIPSIVLYELEYGIARSTSPKKRAAQLEEFSSLVTVLPFNREAANVSASIRVTLEKKGTPIGSHDLLIAGIALVNKGILVTNNTKEFSRVPKIQLDNWFD
jgi:tRNA(fMet)-specific endonuclease VapC